MATQAKRKGLRRSGNRAPSDGHRHGLMSGAFALGLLAALAATVLLVLLAVAYGFASTGVPDQTPNLTATTTPISTSITPSIAWHNFTEGMALAAAEGKPLMLDFYADWCYWCKVLDANVYSDPMVVSASRDFVAVKEEVTGDSPFIDRYSVYYLPLVLWLDTNGTTLLRLDGYVDAPTFLEYMGRALQKFRAQGAP